MTDPFFERPVLNSPYERPSRHWELDETGQPTQKIKEQRRRAELIMPFPASKKRKGSAQQARLVFDEAARKLQSAGQQYDPAIINGVRHQVDRGRELPEAQWQVTPETARLLRHWRRHRFSEIRPFFCQVEAAETAIWLTEVAPGTRADPGPPPPPQPGDRPVGNPLLPARVRYAEGTLFPWTMCDFSLMDAIECGIVKLPRVPVADKHPRRRHAEVPQPVGAHSRRHAETSRDRTLF